MGSRLLQASWFSFGGCYSEAPLHPISESKCLSAPRRFETGSVVPGESAPPSMVHLRHAWANNTWIVCAANEIGFEVLLHPVACDLHPILFTYHWTGLFVLIPSLTSSLTLGPGQKTPLTRYVPIPYAPLHSHPMSNRMHRCLSWTSSGFFDGLVTFQGGGANGGYLEPKFWRPALLATVMNSLLFSCPCHDFFLPLTPDPGPPAESMSV